MPKISQLPEVPSIELSARFVILQDELTWQATSEQIAEMVAPLVPDLVNGTAAIASAVAAETTARAAAIAAETTARAAAIAAETTARAAAIATEATARTTAIATEATARTTAIATEATARTTAVTAEATARADAIAGEATARAAAVTAETAARTTAVTAETTARNAADALRVLKSGDTMTGGLTIPLLNGGPLAGFRNVIINGNFDVWQRGTSFTSSEYGADRWGHGRIGTAHTVTRQAFTLGQTAVPGEPTYFCRTVVTAVAGAGNSSQLFQRIEDVRTFAGQQVTVSFWAKVDATKNISINLTQDFGTGGSPSAEVTGIGLTKVSIGTSWQKVTVTTTLPSISGKTLGADGNHNVTLRFYLDAGSDFNARTDSLGHQSGTFDFAQFQLEAGPVATPFERRPIGTELALCQRYYQKSNAGIAFSFGINSGDNIGAAHPTGNYRGGYKFPVTLRIAPSLTIYDHVGAANRVSYFDAAWNAGGAIDFYGAATNTGFYFGHNILNSIETQFAFSADAEI